MSTVPHKRHATGYFSSASDDDEVPEPAGGISGSGARCQSRQPQAPVSMDANQTATDNPSGARIGLDTEHPKTKRHKKYVFFSFPSVGYIYIYIYIYLLSYLEKIHA